MSYINHSYCGVRGALQSKDHYNRTKQCGKEAEQMCVHVIKECASLDFDTVTLKITSPCIHIRLHVSVRFCHKLCDMHSAASAGKLTSGDTFQSFQIVLRTNVNGSVRGDAVVQLMSHLFSCLVKVKSKPTSYSSVFCTSCMQHTFFYICQSNNRYQSCEESTTFLDSLYQSMFNHLHLRPKVFVFE